jgi:hypothetical protein
MQHLPSLATMEVFVPRYGLTLCPWDNWSNGTNPDWWRSYNNVKHERDAYFHEATLKNALNALAALLTLVFHHYSYATPAGDAPLRAKDTTSILQPESSLMRFHDDFYYSVRICE